jgi:hypothetical protein
MGSKSTRKITRQNSYKNRDNLSIFLCLVLIIGYFTHIFFVFIGSLDIASAYAQSMYLQDHITSLYHFGLFEIIVIAIIELSITFWYYRQDSISQKQLLLISLGIICLNYSSYFFVDFIYISRVLPVV